MENKVNNLVDDSVIIAEYITSVDELREAVNVVNNAVQQLKESPAERIYFKSALDNLISFANKYYKIADDVDKL